MSTEVPTANLAGMLSVERRFTEMTADEKLLHIAVIFLALEHKYLREPLNKPQISADAKLLFLIGPENFDVTTASSFTGEKIYTRGPASRTKFPEILEAVDAISGWFDLVDETKADTDEALPSRVKPISEVCDVVYCLAQLTMLDSEFEIPYRRHIENLAKAGGFSVDELLLITLVKYNYRLGQGKSRKNFVEEEALIDALFKGDGSQNLAPVHLPNGEEMMNLSRKLGFIFHDLKARFEQLRIRHISASS